MEAHQARVERSFHGDRVTLPRVNVKLIEDQAQRRFPDSDPAMDSRLRPRARIESWRPIERARHDQSTTPPALSMIGAMGDSERTQMASLTGGDDAERRRMLERLCAGATLPPGRLAASTARRTGIAAVTYEPAG